MAPGVSQSPYLRGLAAAFATIFIGFGVNAIVQPANAITFFELPMPHATADRKLVESLLAVYGIRDIFMGIAIYLAAALGNSKTLGGLTLAASAVAFGDGLVCFYNGAGHMNHWGYAPMVAAVGLLLLGVVG